MNKFLTLILFESSIAKYLIDEVPHQILFHVSRRPLLKCVGNILNMISFRFRAVENVPGFTF